MKAKVRDINKLGGYNIDFDGVYRFNTDETPKYFTAEMLKYIGQIIEVKKRNTWYQGEGYSWREEWLDFDYNKPRMPERKTRCIWW